MSGTAEGPLTEVEAAFIQLEWAQALPLSDGAGGMKAVAPFGSEYERWLAYRYFCYGWAAARGES